MYQRARRLMMVGPIELWDQIDMRRHRLGMVQVWRRMGRSTAQVYHQAHGKKVDDAAERLQPMYPIVRPDDD